MSASFKTVKAKFVSVWDDTIVLSTTCNVNLETKEVFDIAQVEADGLDTLTEEYIELMENGKSVKHNVYPKDEAREDEFWYD